MLHEFAKPFVFEGTEYPSIDLNLDGLTGQDLLDAERDFTQSGGSAMVLATNQTYLAYVAAKAISKPIDFILALPAKEFSKVVIQVQGFLLS